MERTSALHAALTLREYIGYPNITHRFIQELLDTMFNPLIDGMVGKVNRKPKQTFSQIRAFGQQMFLETGSQPSPLELSAHYSGARFIRVFEDLALQLVIRDHAPSFVAAYDISQGGGFVIANLVAAEEFTRGSSEQLQTSTKRFESEGMRINTEDRLAILRRTNRGSRLIQEDLTGFKLVEEVVKWVEGQSNCIEEKPEDYPTMMPFQVPEFVTTGARGAERFYKAIYPLATQV